MPSSSCAGRCFGVRLGDDFHQSLGEKIRTVDFFLRVAAEFFDGGGVEVMAADVIEERAGVAVGGRERLAAAVEGGAAWDELEFYAPHMWSYLDADDAARATWQALAYTEHAPVGNEALVVTASETPTRSQKTRAICSWPCCRTMALALIGSWTPVARRSSK